MSLARQVWRERRREVVVQVVEGRVDAIRKADVTRTGLRLYEGGKIGVAGTLGEADPASLEPAARQALAHGVAYPAPEGEPRHRRVESGEPAPDATEFVAQVEGLLEALRADFPELLFSNQFACTHEEVWLEGDPGLELASSQYSAGGGLIFKQRGSPHLLDGFVTGVGRRWQPEAFLAHARDLCEAFFRPVALEPAERVPVVCSGASGLGLPLAWFGDQLEGQRFGVGATRLSERRGERVFSPDFHLVQSTHPDDGVGPFFDAEGTVSPGDRALLIDAGVVARPYTDRRTAARYDLPLTGAAQAAYDGVPTLGKPALRVVPQARTLAEVLGGRKAVFVAMSAGGESTSEGRYSTPVQLAYLHDGERFVGRLPELHLRASLEEALGEGLLGAPAEPWPAFSADPLLVCEMQVEVTGVGG